MTRIQILLIFILVCSFSLFRDMPSRLPALVLSIPGASPPEQPPPLHFFPKPTALPNAFAKSTPAEVLGQVIDKYRPENTSWVEMTVWQRARIAELRYEVEGKYRSAPHGRLHMELTLGRDKQTRMLLVSDGNTLKQVMAIPGQPEEITITPLPRIQVATDDPAAIASARESLLREKGVRGVTPLLEEIHANMPKPRLNAVLWQDQVLLEIRGDWQPDEKLLQTVSADLRFRQKSRECRLYLDAKTLWPVRVEWWGSVHSGEVYELLFEMEFREPILNRPLPPEKLATEFLVQ